MDLFGLGFGLNSKKLLDDDLFQLCSLLPDLKTNPMYSICAYLDILQQQISITPP